VQLCGIRSVAIGRLTRWWPPNWTAIRNHSARKRTYCGGVLGSEKWVYWIEGVNSAPPTFNTCHNNGAQIFTSQPQQKGKGIGSAAWVSASIWNPIKFNWKLHHGCENSHSKPKRHDLAAVCRKSIGQGFSSSQFLTPQKPHKKENPQSPSIYPHYPHGSFCTWRRFSWGSIAIRKYFSYGRSVGCAFRSIPFRYWPWQYMAYLWFSFCHAISLWSIVDINRFAPLKSITWNWDWFML